MSNCNLQSFEVGGANPYMSATGDLTTKRAAKKIGAQIFTLSEVTPNFREDMVKVYNGLIKKSDPLKTAAIKNIQSENGVEAAFEAVQIDGVPKSKKGLEKHNATVTYLLAYPIPNVENTVEGCQTLYRTLQNLEAEEKMQNERQQSGARTVGTEAALRVIAERKKNINKLISENDCAKLIATQEEKQEQEATAAAIKAGTGGGQQSKTFTYVAYGMAGLVVVVALVLLIRKKNK